MLGHHTPHIMLLLDPPWGQPSWIKGYIEVFTSDWSEYMHL